MNSYLCRCNNCYSLYRDTNPSTSSIQLPLFNYVKSLKDHSCPTCKTEAYLSDIVLVDCGNTQKSVQRLVFTYGVFTSLHAIRHFELHEQYHAAKFIYDQVFYFVSGHYTFPKDYEGDLITDHYPNFIEFGMEIRFDKENPNHKKAFLKEFTEIVIDNN